MHLPRETADSMCDFTDLSQKDFEDILQSVLNQEDIKKFTPDGECVIDPRTGIRVIYSEKRAKRPHDNRPDAPASGEAAPSKPCPVCEGKTTRIIDLADLSEGYTFINKNLFPILYPEGIPEKEYNFLNPVPSTSSTPAYGMHFLQWPSNYHDRDFENMPVDDSAIVLQRLALLEERILHSDRDEFPDTAGLEDDVHVGYSGIIKNFGHLVGGSLAHGHQQIAFTNIMPAVLADDIRFRDKNGESFISFLKRENSPGLTLGENGNFACVVPWFMKRPLQTIIYYKGDHEYFHHIPSEEMKDLAALLKKNIGSVISLMDQIGREPAYNIIFHSGPGSEFYLEMLPYTQETGGYEYLGIYVCQGSVSSTLDFYRKYADF